MIFRREANWHAYQDYRARMIAQTSAFLTWAMAQERGLPRIPVRRVDEGGFTEPLSRPGARALVGRWWQRTLDLLRRDL